MEWVEVATQTAFGLTITASAMPGTLALAVTRPALQGFAIRSSAVVLAVDIPAVALIAMCAIPSGAVGSILRLRANEKFPKAPKGL